ncbi:SMP-30/gluconolactonase/LRE family protein [Maribacter sp. 2304DJ31-5]|uniref:SMP-30/gluconolactonase/LRE family protein n=1 Tax=Maribacter sp. 2304DJ31-5 TaxID=3386273 RepID=UPI0039BC3557
MKKQKTLNIALFLLVLFSCNAYIHAQNSKIISDGAELTLVAEDYEFTEGPAVDSKGNVYFTDQPNDRILKWDRKSNTVSTYMQPSGRSNGLYFDHEGNLLAAADEKNELWKIDSKKNITVLISDFEGKRLNGPNDLWVDPDGGIYFTDPYYQRPWWNRTEPEIKERRVYYITPDMKETKIVAEGMVRPNGIIGTPNGKILYIADIGGEKTYSFSIEKDGSLTNKKLFVEMGSDGMTLDNEGNVYLTGDGVSVFDPQGNQISHIPVNEKWTANVTFGGSEQDILFITAMDSVYTLKMNVHGVR